MAESEEIAGLKIGFSADVGELEASLVAARESLNSWLAEQRGKVIKIRVTPDKDTKSFDSIVSDVEKQLQALANQEPVPIKISLAPTVESIRASKDRIGKALSPVEVEVVGKFVGWSKGGEPKIEQAPTGAETKRGRQAAAPAQPTQGAGDCCEDIVTAIKALGTKLEALAQAAPGQSNVTREKTAKTSPATAAKQAAESAPPPASKQAAASAAPKPTPTPPPSTAKKGAAFSSFEEYLASPGNQQAIAGGRATPESLRAVWDKRPGATPTQPAKQKPVRPRAEAVAPAQVAAAAAAGGTVDFDNGSIEVPPADDRAAKRRAADAARAERQNVPWTCPDCGETLTSSKPSRISAHKASKTHLNRTAQRTRSTTRAAARTAAPAAALPAATPDEMAAYRDALHAEAADLQANVDLSQVPYRSPTYTGPTRRQWIKFPSLAQVMAVKAGAVDPETGMPITDETGRIASVDMSGASMVQRGGRRMGRRGTRLSRNLLKTTDFPAVEANRALLERRREVLEQMRPRTEGEQIRDRILETGGAIMPGASTLEDAFRFGKDLPAAERQHITARLKQAGQASLAAPTGGRRTPITGEEFASLQGQLGRTPTDNEIRQRMIELEQQTDADPLKAFLEDIGSTDEIPKVTWDDLGWGTFDKDVRKALASRGGERDDAAHAVLDAMGLGKIPDLAEQDPDFAKSLQSITELVTGRVGAKGEQVPPQFATAIAAIEPEMRNLRAQAPTLTAALGRGFLLPKSVPADAPASQVQKRFLALNALRESATAGMQIGALGEYKPEGMGEEAMRAMLEDVAEALGVPVESLMSPGREPKAQGPVMPTQATMGQAGRRGWLLGRKERTPEQQAELRELDKLERARRRTVFAERLSTRKPAAPAAKAAPPRPIGTSYPPKPREVREIADERQAGIEWMARLFSYGERSPQEEEQLSYLQGQYPRAVRTARDLYPQEEPEETEARKVREAEARGRREHARLRNLIRNEGNLSPLQQKELGRLEKTYPAMAKYTRDPGSVSTRPIRGLGADIDPLEALRAELGSTAGRLGSTASEMSMAGGEGRQEYSDLVGQLASTQRDLELLNTYFPTGKYADPVKAARGFVGRPLRRPNTSAVGRRQAASLILARQQQERDAAPPASTAATDILSRADAYIASTQPGAGTTAQQAPVRPTTRGPGGRFRYQTRRTAGGRTVAHQVSKAIGQRGNETFEQAVKRLHDAGQLNDNLRDQILASTAARGRSLEDILSYGQTQQAAGGAGAPQPAAAAGVGAPPSPAAAAGAAAARQPAAGAGVPLPPVPPGPGGPGRPGGPLGGGPQRPVTPPPTGVRYRSLNAIVQSARERGVGEERLAPLALQQDVGRVPDFPNPFQQTRLFGNQQPGMLPGGQTPTLQARLLSARAGVAEQIQLTPVRALSVAFGQYAATLGARGGVRGRQLEFESLSGRAAKAVNLEEDALLRRRALVEERRTLTAGSKEYDANTQELRGVRMQHRVLHKRAVELTQATELAAKGVSTLGTQFANLAFGAAGIVGGTLAFGATLAVGQAAVGALAEASKPMVEQMTGYTHRIRAVTEGLRTGAMPTGDVGGTVAAALSGAGVGGALAQSLAGPLAARTQQSVQNERLNQTIDLMRTAFQTRRDEAEFPGVTNYRGVYQPTGGLNILGLQTNIGAEQSFLERAGQMFQQSSGNSGMFNRLFRPDMSFADIGAAAQGNPFAQFYTNQFDQGEARARYDQIRQQSLDNLSIFEGTQRVGIRAVNPDLERFEGRGEISPGDRDRQAEMLQGIAPDVADAINAGSLAFVDANGRVVTSLEELDRALNAAAEEFAKPDAAQLVESMRRPLQAAVMGIQDNLEYQLSRAMPANRALNRLTQPPTPFGFGMTGAPGAAGAVQAGALAQFPEAAGLMDQRAQLRRNDMRALLSLPGVDRGMVQQLQAYGDEVLRVQTAMAGRQNNLGAMQYNEQLRLATQQYGDLLGLAGQVGSVEQSRVGQLERQNMLISRRIEDLGREAQAMSLAQSQRQINFQLATSRFTSSGATPAEAAAQARYAEQQAAYAQSQLDIQRQIFDEQGRLIPNQREIQDTTIERQVEALENAINIMEEGFATEQFVKAGQSYLETLAGANAGLIEGMGAIVGAGQQIDQLAIQTRNQIFAQTGEDVDIIKAGVDDVFTDLLDRYDDFASRIQLPGFDYEPRAPEPTTPTGGQPSTNFGPNAAGALFDVDSPTTATFGEAGSETVAILRNPRTHLVSGGGGGGSVAVSINFNGEVNVREDTDIDRIAYAVKQLFNRETELLGLRR